MEKFPKVQANFHSVASVSFYARFTTILKLSLNSIMQMIVVDLSVVIKREDKIYFSVFVEVKSTAMKDAFNLFAPQISSFLPMTTLPCTGILIFKPSTLCH